MQEFQLNKISHLLQAIDELPAFPANLANKGSDGLPGPHDETRVQLEQVIVNYARANVLYNAIVNEKISDEGLEKLILKMFDQQVAGETGKNGEPEKTKRAEALGNAIRSDINEIFYRYKNNDVPLELSHIRQVVKSECGLLNEFLADNAHFDLGDGKELRSFNPNELMEKGYQLDLKDGTLHSISNERQYEKGQRLDDLVKIFNETAGADEFEKKKQFYEEYFQRLAKSSAYKDKAEISIMDVGVENGDLTKHIAETALKYFPEKKISIVAVERSGNFLADCTAKMEKLVNENEGKVTYTPVAHHIGGFGAPVTEKKANVSNVDIFLVTDVRNFSTQNIVEEFKLYAADDAVALFKHGNRNDFQDKMREALGKEVRNAADKVTLIEKDLESIGYDKIARGEMRAAFGFGFGKIDDEMKATLLNIKQGDFLNQPFKEGSPEYSKQRILEFIVGAPLAAFSPEVREKAIDLFNQHMEKGYAELCAGCQFFSVHNKELSKEQQQSFEGSVKAVNPMAQFVGKDWNYLSRN